ncbi:hypothetical protein KSF_083610 [Reticulibacter mediterranei]|uniref:DUF2569 domain-containing protein n=1 Tax=Reticulibacter mediterranei TaxID=2778369 RepID=A0A8J3IQF1_9CHLR|nr:hypothetical protein [Reticulibacter mediterranei]GHO98313.1 hypothetical protein KSF_083610 [Reticulibacter mediterranei]
MNQMISNRLQQALIAFFVFCALFIVVAYIVDPIIITDGLKLSQATGRYPLVASAFVLLLLLLIGLMIVGIVRRWRWLFWLLLIDFTCSTLQVPAAILQLNGLLPETAPAWYILSRAGVGLLQVALACWMWWIYWHYGVWAMGRKKSVRA